MNNNVVVIEKKENWKYLNEVLPGTFFHFMENIKITRPYITFETDPKDVWMKTNNENIIVNMKNGYLMYFNDDIFTKNNKEMIAVKVVCPENDMLCFHEE